MHAKLFIHAKHSPTKLYQCICTVLHSNQSIHINLSAGAQNITGANVIIMFVCRRLLTMRLPGKSKITLEKQQKLFVQGYNLEVHDVIKYTRKHNIVPL